MRKKINIACILLLLSIACSNKVLAQQAVKASATLKKTVVRDLNLQEPVDKKKHYLKSTGRDTTFMQLLIEAIKTGKITAYSGYDNSFKVKLTAKEIDDMFIESAEQTGVDPETGEEALYRVIHGPNYEGINKFRVLEEWTFNRETGNTAIHIVGVAPLTDTYGNGGDYQGSEPVLWVKYNELLPLMARYDQSHPGKILPNHIWNDYFYTDVKPTQQ